MSEQNKLANKEGSRRTVYYTKRLPESTNGYARVQQYLGEWKDNKWEGKGTLEKADGSRYVGTWVAGKRHGTGTLWNRNKDGSLRKVYTGQWANDLQQGRGVYNYPSGDTYNGDWKSGLRHGVGILQEKDRSVYEGEWFADKPHGFGVLDYPNGDHFEGAWVDGLKEGQGVHFYFSMAKRVHTKRCAALAPRGLRCSPSFCPVGSGLARLAY